MKGGGSGLVGDSIVGVIGALLGGFLFGVPERLRTSVLQSEADGI